jgi:hypothetical protein
MLWIILLVLLIVIFGLGTLLEAAFWLLVILAVIAIAGVVLGGRALGGRRA